MWPPYSLLAEAVSPAGAVSGDLTTYILGYGPIGIAVVVGAILLYKGWQLISPARLSEVTAGVREDGRADLLREIEHLQAELTKTQDQRDEALKLAQTQIVPLLTSFVGTTSALLPLLQDLVNMREDLRRNTRRSGDR